MLTPVLLLAAMFVAGFFAGFAARSWRSYQRRTRHRVYGAAPAAKPSRRQQPVSAFGHMRRAF